MPFSVSRPRRHARVTALARVAAVSALLSGLTTTLLAANAPLVDGKFYVRERVPPDLPYQRAILWFGDGTETLLIQSQYVLAGAGTSAALGWVVPVPAVPEVASLPADVARSVFFRLAWVSQPSVTRVSVWLIGLGIPLLVVLMLVLAGLSSKGDRPVPTWARRVLLLPKATAKKQRGALLGRALILVVCWMLAAISIPRFSSSVNVLEEQKAGIYDVRVVTAEQASSLIEWLNENEFAFTDSDRAVIDDYLEAGWVFVVAKVGQRTDVEDAEVVSEGLAAPLILRFPSELPVYPVALTSTVEQKTEILIYICSDYKMSGDGRLELHAAVRSSGFGAVLVGRMASVDPPGFLSEGEAQLNYVTKFKGVLTPDQMREDLTFRVAPDDEPYRRHEVRF